MPDFSIEYDPKSDIAQYLKTFEKNSNKTPFFDTRLFTDNELAVFHIKPLIFPLFVISPIIWGAGFVFTGGFSKGFFITGCIPGISYLFYNRWWYILMLYIGKWKNKYRGKIKVL